MSNPNQWVLVKQITKVTVYSGNAVRYKAKNGAWVDKSTLTFDMHGSRECYRAIGKAAQHD